MAIGIPNVADVVRGWLSTMKAERITSVIVNGDVEEISTPVTFKGMIQVQSPYQLSLTLPQFPLTTICIRLSHLLPIKSKVSL